MKMTLSIAIPVYNEEKNIASLLESLLVQEQKNFELKEIVLYSDGTTDNTLNIVAEIMKRNKIIRLVKNAKRMGKYFRVNQAFHDCKTDMLVVLDADIVPVGTHFLESLTDKMNADNKAQMIAAHQILIKPDTFIGKIIYTNFVLWDYVRWSIPNYETANNFYGSATAYRGEFARNVDIPEGLLDPHLFIYLSADKKKGFRYCREAEILQHPISTFHDFNKFLQRSIGKPDEKLEKMFGVKTEEVYFVPKKYKIIGMLKSFMHEPFYTPLSFLLNIYMKLKPKAHTDKHYMWERVQSTKKKVDHENKKPAMIISSFDDIENPYYGGGGAYAVHEIAKRFTKEYEVTVLTGIYPGAKNKIVDDVYYGRISTNIFGPKLNQLFFQFCLPFYVMTKNFDIWMESFTPPFSTAFLQLFTKKPVIGIIHMLSGADMLRKYKVPFYLIENMGLKTYKHFIVTSVESEKSVKKINPKAEVQIIPNGVNIPERTNKNSTKKYVLYIGRIEMNQKGLDLLLNAWKKIESKTNLKLAIAGTGIFDELKKLEKMISHLDLKKSVKLFGKVTGKEKENLYNESAFVVLPSRFETFSLVILEAFSHNLPVICFDIKGLKWIPENNCLKVKKFNDTDLATAIESLVTKNDLRKKLTNGMDTFIESKTWNSTFEKYDKYVNSLLPKYA